MKCIPCVGLILVAGILTGCDTTTGVTGRIQEKSAVYAQLTAEQKKNIETGTIEYGYNADMVYMALGKPSKVREKAAPEGTVVMWTYNNYYPSVAVVQMALNDPSRKYRAAPLTTNYPGTGPGGTTAASISSTKPAGPEPGVESLAEVPSETLHVLFLDGKVFQVNLEE